MIYNKTLKILWLDIETTGLDWRIHDAIQIAGILDVDTIAAEEFSFLVRPFDFSTISEEALRINGRSIEELRDFPEPGIVHARLKELFGRYVDKYDRSDKMFIAGQNPSFDRDFLKRFFEKNEDPYFGSWFDYHIIDLCSLSLIFHLKGIIDLMDADKGKISVRLGNVAEAFQLVQKTPHDALDDIKLTRKIFYEHMIDRFF